jgi:hypothetical protein
MHWVPLALPVLLLYNPATLLLCRSTVLETHHMTKPHLQRLIVALSITCLLVSLPAALRSQETGKKDQKADSGFVPLFNGKDLSGWQTTGAWVYEPGGVLALKPGRRRLIPDYQSFLWSTEMYENFVLDLEFKLAKGGSSGVFMRSTSTRSYLQAQIRDSYGQPGLGNDTAGAIVDVAAPTKNLAKPAGEWNHMIITCDGNRMQVELNGEQVVNADLSQSQKARPVRPGRIGFENAGSPVAFRNVRIKQLTQK